jgi:hypothetical protein
MFNYIPTSRLAASSVSPLKTAPRFRSDLLLPKNKNWAQSVNYLRDFYTDIQLLWGVHESESNDPYDPEKDRQIFKKLEPMLHELILGMDGVSKERTQRMDIAKAIQTAIYDFETATTYAQTTDYAMALVYFNYALDRIHYQLDSLTIEANKENSSRKLGYGYDTSGNIGEQGGTSGNDRHQWDTGNSPKLDRTPMNPANMGDFEAENDYPELAKFKHKRVFWPPRTR